MIAVQTIIDRCNAQLDAEGSERYLFDNDFKPAINYAQEYVVSLFNSIFSQNKLSEESLRDLLKVRCWKTSQYSRVKFEDDALTDVLWTIVSVNVNCTTSGDTSTGADTTISYYLPNVKYISSEYSAKRITLEEYNRAKNNPFEAGNNIVTTDWLKDYCYINLADYGNGAEIEISPVLNQKVVSLAYLKKPSEVTLVTDDIEFPESLTGLIVDTVLSVIAVKQGDGTNLATMKARDENKLVTLLS